MAVLYTDTIKKANSAQMFSKMTYASIFMLLCIIILPLVLIIRTHSKLPAKVIIVDRLLDD